MMNTIAAVAATVVELFRRDFDKLLLMAVFLLLVFLVVHMGHDARDTAEINWAREQAGTVLGALLTLITGVALRNRDAPPSPPPSLPKKEGE